MPEPVTAGAAILGGGSLISGMMGSEAAEDAAHAQGQAADQATAEQRRQYNLTRHDLAPWRNAGVESVRNLRRALRSGELTDAFTLGEFVQDPGYEFRLGEGNKAIERAARARGMYMSPATVKELLRYGQDFASNEFSNAFNRDMANRTSKYNMLSGAAGGGQTAANTIGNAGQNMAGNIGNLVTGAANARGAAGIAGANAWGGAINNVGNLYNQYQNQQMQQGWMDRMYPPR